MDMQPFPHIHAVLEPTDPLVVALCAREAMVAKVGGVFGTLTYRVTPSPNTTVFGILWPPSIALWGSLVFPYTLVVQ